MAVKNPRNILAVAFIKIDRTQKPLHRLDIKSAFRLVKDALKAMRKEIGAHGGTEIKIISGDTIMCSFPNAVSAAQAAFRGQERLKSGKYSGQPADDERILASIGISHGRVLLDAGDLFGQVVNIAARIAAEAKTGQILLDSGLFNALPPSLKCRVRFVDRMPAKGISKPLDVYEFMWEGEDVITHTKEAAVAIVAGHSRCTLQYRNRNLVLDAEKTSATLGRGVDADLVINDENASRLHLKIDYRRGKYVLTDESRNGTWIKTGKGLFQLQRKETHVLQGKGQISLGLPPAKTKEIVIFECV